MNNNDFNDQKEIQKTIIKMIVFFDLFDYPLTTWEIWQYFDKKINLVLLINLLSEITILSKKDGFFFLNKREEILISRQRRYNYSRRKIKKALKFSQIFAYLPFVEMVSLVNSIGAYNLRDESDIDFFIISHPGKIWLTRLYCTGIAAFLNQRPRENNKQDKICLSFYISSDSLNLDALKLKPRDPYFFFWLKNLVVLYERGSIYENFLLSNRLKKESSIFNRNKRLSESRYSFKYTENLSFLENLAKKIQLYIMPSELKKAASNSRGVVINNKTLKLYLRDNRIEYLKKYGNKLKQILA